MLGLNWFQVNHSENIFCFLWFFVSLFLGLIIAVVIILAIFFISSISGRILFYLLLLLFLVITLSIALICFVDYQKRQIKQFETNELDRNRSGFNVQGIRFIPVGDYVWFILIFIHWSKTNCLDHSSQDLWDQSFYNSSRLNQTSNYRNESILRDPYGFTKFFA